MAELVEGTYAIISVRSGMALDVLGASDKSGTTVIQYTYTKGDAQIWNLMHPLPYHFDWYIVSSLSGKLLGALPTHAPGKDVGQYTIEEITKDNRDGSPKTFPYWHIEPVYNYVDGEYIPVTHTFNNTAYQVYNILSSEETGPFYALDVAGGSIELKANVLLWTNTNAVNQQWIFVPVDTLSEGGTYKIGLAADTKMRIDISSASKATATKAVVWPDHDADNQIFKIEIDRLTGCVRFIAAHSGLCLDIEGGSAVPNAKVVQYTIKNSDNANQLWLPVQDGTVVYNGQPYPRYEIRSQSNANFVMDCLGGNAKALTNIGVWQKNNAINQRFFFIKTERNVLDIEMPGEINERLFEEETVGDPVDVEVKGLTFNSNQTEFQARYMVVKYTAGRKKSDTAVKWTSIVNAGETPSTAREGWGDAWNSTFSIPDASNGGIVSLPLDIIVTLDAEWQTADVIVEVRACSIKYKDSTTDYEYAAHGPIKRSVIKVVQRPKIFLKSMVLYSDSGKKTIGVATTLTDSLNSGCERLRGRLVDANGDPISEWVSESSMRINHVVNESLRKLPSDGEVVYFEYTMLTLDGASIVGKLEHTFSYSPNDLPVPTIEPTIEYLEDDSCCAIVSSTANEIDYCLMEIFDTDGTTLITSALVSSDNNTNRWKIVPPLNRNVGITVIGANDEGLTAWGLGTIICNIPSKLFIWNWTENVSSDPYDGYTSILVNKSDIPKQTRKYATSLTANSPSGRLNPVAFSDINIVTNLGISGVVVEDEYRDRCYPILPQHTTMTDIRRLIRLSGKGIHPVYRTPDGDWHYAGIQSIDIQKTKEYFYSVTVEQIAVED